MPENESTASDRIAQNIRTLRKKRGWSMAELARRSGLSENIIEDIEGRRRHRRVTAEEIEAIGTALYETSYVLDLFAEPERAGASIRMDSFTSRVMELLGKLGDNPEWAVAEDRYFKAHAVLDAARAEMAAAEAQIVHLVAHWVKDHHHA